MKDNCSEEQDLWRTTPWYWRNLAKWQLLFSWSGSHWRKEAFGKSWRATLSGLHGQGLEKFQGQRRWWAQQASIMLDKAHWGPFSIRLPFPWGTVQSSRVSAIGRRYRCCFWRGYWFLLLLPCTHTNWAWKNWRFQQVVAGVAAGWSDCTGEAEQFWDYTLEIWRKKKNGVDWTLARMISVFLPLGDESLHHGDFSFKVWNGFGE